MPSPPRPAADGACCCWRAGWQSARCARHTELLGLYGARRRKGGTVAHLRAASTRSAQRMLKPLGVAVIHTGAEGEAGGSSNAPPAWLCSPLHRTAPQSSPESALGSGRGGPASLLGRWLASSCARLASSDEISASAASRSSRRLPSHSSRAISRATASATSSHASRRARLYSSIPAVDAHRAVQIRSAPSSTHPARLRTRSLMSTLAGMGAKPRQNRSIESVDKSSICRGAEGGVPEP